MATYIFIIILILLVIFSFPACSYAYSKIRTKKMYKLSIELGLNFEGPKVRFLEVYDHYPNKRNIISGVYKEKNIIIYDFILGKYDKEEFYERTIPNYTVIKIDEVENKVVGSFFPMFFLPSIYKIRASLNDLFN